MNTEVKEKTIKKYNQHLHLVELSRLEKEAIPLILEQRSILKSVNASSLAEFEAMLNLKTSFVNANLSAQALGKETELKRLQEIEVALNKYDVSTEDLTLKGEFKTSYLNNLKERYIEYYTDNELSVLELLKKAIKSYNAIPFDYRKKIIVDNRGEMIFNPFNRL